MARSNNERLRKGRPKLNSNGNGSYRRGGSTRRMPHGGYHGPGQMQTSSTVSTQRTAVRNRVAPVRPVRPIPSAPPVIQNSISVNNIQTMYPEWSYLTYAALIDCPHIGDNPERIQTTINSCPDTGAIQTIRSYMVGGSSGNNPMGWAEFCCTIGSWIPGASGRCCDKVPDPGAGETT